MAPPPPPPPSVKEPKAAAFHMWKQREQSDTVGPVYPMSPSSKKAKAMNNSEARNKLKKGKKKMYFPASQFEKPSPPGPEKFGTSPTRTQSLGDPAPSALVGGNKKLLHKTMSCPVKKSVQFGESNVVFHVETIDELSTETVAAVWWSSRDYKEIQQEYEAVLFLLETGKEVPPEHSARGLNKRTEEGAWELYENQRNARNAVLSQQDVLRKQKKTDPELIAEAYRKESEKTQKEALEQAQRDAAEVQSYLTKAGARQRVLSYVKVKRASEKPRHKTKLPPTTLNDSFAQLGVLAKRNADGGGVLHFSDDDEIPGIVDDDASIDTFAQTSGDDVAEKVKFQSELEYIQPRKVTDLEKDIERCWYSKSDLERIESEFEPLLKQMEETAEKGDSDATKDVGVDEGKDSRRGLEKSTEAGARKLEERRQFATKAVRALQWKNHGAEAIAAAYYKITKEARKEAAKFGKQDAKEAKKYRLKKKHAKSPPKRTCSEDSRVSIDLPSSPVRRFKRAGFNDSGVSTISNVSNVSTDFDTSGDCCEQPVVRQQTIPKSPKQRGTEMNMVINRRGSLPSRQPVVVPKTRSTGELVQMFSKRPTSIPEADICKAQKSPLQRTAGVHVPSTEAPSDVERLSPAPSHSENDEGDNVSKVEKTGVLPTISLHGSDSDPTSGENDEDLSGRSLLDLDNDFSETGDPELELEIVETPHEPQPEKPPSRPALCRRRRLSGSHAPSLRDLETTRESIRDMAKMGIVSASPYKKMFDAGPKADDASWRRKNAQRTVSESVKGSEKIAQPIERAVSETAKGREETVSKIATMTQTIEPASEALNVVEESDHSCKPAITDSVKGREEIVAKIVSTTHIDEPTSDGLNVQVVQHVFSSSASVKDGIPLTEQPKPATMEATEAVCEKTTKVTEIVLKETGEEATEAVHKKTTEVTEIVLQETGEEATEAVGEKKTEATGIGLKQTGEEATEAVHKKTTEVTEFVLKETGEEATEAVHKKKTEVTEIVLKQTGEEATETVGEKKTEATGIVLKQTGEEATETVGEKKTEVTEFVLKETGEEATEAVGEKKTEATGIVLKETGEEATEAVGEKKTEATGIVLKQTGEEATETVGEKKTEATGIVLKQTGEEATEAVGEKKTEATGIVLKQTGEEATAAVGEKTTEATGIVLKDNGEEATEAVCEKATKATESVLEETGEEASEAVCQKTTEATQNVLKEVVHEKTAEATEFLLKATGEAESIAPSTPSEGEGSALNVDSEIENDKSDSYDEENARLRGLTALGEASGSLSAVLTDTAQTLPKIASEEFDVETTIVSTDSNGAGDAISSELSSRACERAQDYLSDVMNPTDEQSTLSASVPFTTSDACNENNEHQSSVETNAEETGPLVNEEGTADKQLVILEEVKAKPATSEDDKTTLDTSENSKEPVDTDQSSLVDSEPGRDFVEADPSPSMKDEREKDECQNDNERAADAEDEQSSTIVSEREKDAVKPDPSPSVGDGEKGKIECQNDNERAADTEDEQSRTIVGEPKKDAVKADPSPSVEDGEKEKIECQNENEGTPDSGDAVKAEGAGEAEDLVEDKKALEVLNDSVTVTRNSNEQKEVVFEEEEVSCAVSSAEAITIPPKANSPDLDVSKPDTERRSTRNLTVEETAAEPEQRTSHVSLGVEPEEISDIVSLNAEAVGQPDTESRAINKDGAGEEQEDVASDKNTKAPANECGTETEPHTEEQPTAASTDEPEPKEEPTKDTIEGSTGVSACDQTAHATPKDEVVQQEAEIASPAEIVNDASKGGWKLRGFRKLFKKARKDAEPKLGFDIMASASPYPAETSVKRKGDEEEQDENVPAAPEQAKDQPTEHQTPDAVPHESNVENFSEGSPLNKSVPHEPKTDSQSAISDLSDDVFDSKSKPNTTATEECTSSSTVADEAASTEDGESDVIWFKARAKDVVTITMDDGRIVYLMEADKCTKME